MSAVNPLPTPPQASGTSEKRAYEPSMEEILASIRRIIADDQSLPKHPSIDPIAATAEPAHEPPLPPEPMPFPDLRAATAPEMSTVSAPPPVHVAAVPPIDPTGLASEPAPSRSAPEALTVEALAAYEPIAAPQYPIPHGPVGDDVSAHLHPHEPASAVSEFVHEEPLAELSPAPTEPPLAPEPLSQELSSPEQSPPEPFHGSSPHEPSPYDAPLGEMPLHAAHASARAARIDEDEPLYATPIEPPQPRATHRPSSSLFSDATDSSVSSAFNMLAASRLADNSDELLNLAREMIRPLLRAWLDDNLPSMVERMVRSEIERVARGGR